MTQIWWWWWRACSIVSCESWLKEFERPKVSHLFNTRVPRKCHGPKTNSRIPSRAALKSPRIPRLHLKIRWLIVIYAISVGLKEKILWLALMSVAFWLEKTFCFEKSKLLIAGIYWDVRDLKSGEEGPQHAPCDVKPSLQNKPWRLFVWFTTLRFRVYRQMIKILIWYICIF